MTCRFEDFCCCPNCRADLTRSAGALRCRGCERSYPIENGIAVLMPEYGEDDTPKRYHRNYEQIADNFLKTNKYEADKVEFRHSRLLQFIGGRRRGRVLDIGASHGAYLNDIRADLRVAFDIARTYLEVMPSSPDLMRVQGDAERLPFKAGFFDTIILADILEHLRHPERAVEWIHEICTDETAVFVHIPWEENLEPYLNTPWEFSHLRSFNAYTHAALWHKFAVRRERVTYPDLRYPLLFQFERILPRFVYNRLVRRYFFRPGVPEREAAWRRRRLEALPRGEWWLLWIFKPVFKMYEMRRRRAPVTVRQKLQRWTRRLRRPTQATTAPSPPAGERVTLEHAERMM